MIDPTLLVHSGLDPHHSVSTLDTGIDPTLLALHNPIRSHYRYFVDEVSIINAARAGKRKEASRSKLVEEKEKETRMGVGMMGREAEEEGVIEIGREGTEGLGGEAGRAESSNTPKKGSGSGPTKPMPKLPRDWGLTIDVMSDFINSNPSFRSALLPLVKIRDRPFGTAKPGPTTGSYVKPAATISRARKKEKAVSILPVGSLGGEGADGGADRGKGAGVEVIRDSIQQDGQQEQAEGAGSTAPSLPDGLPDQNEIVTPIPTLSDNNFEILPLPTDVPTLCTIPIDTPKPNKKRKRTPAPRSTADAQEPTPDPTSDPEASPKALTRFKKSRKRKPVLDEDGNVVIKKRGRPAKERSATELAAIARRQALIDAGLPIKLGRPRKNPDSLVRDGKKAKLRAQSELMLAGGSDAGEGPSGVDGMVEGNAEPNPAAVNAEGANDGSSEGEDDELATHDGQDRMRNDAEDGQSQDGMEGLAAYDLATGTSIDHNDRDDRRDIAADQEADYTGDQYVFDDHAEEPQSAAFDSNMDSPLHEPIPELGQDRNDIVPLPHGDPSEDMMIQSEFTDDELSQIHLQAEHHGDGDGDDEMLGLHMDEGTTEMNMLQQMEMARTVADAIEAASHAQLRR